MPLPHFKSPTAPKPQHVHLLPLFTPKLVVRPNLEHHDQRQPLRQATFHAEDVDWVLQLRQVQNRGGNSEILLHLP